MTAARRPDKREDKRARILESAVKVFAEKGFFGATVAEVARAAGVADGTIYLYFKSKDELLLTLFDEKMGELARLASEAIAGAKTADARLRRLILLHLKVVEDNPQLASVLILELRQSSTFLKDYDKSRLSNYLDLIGKVVKDGQAAREFRGDVSPQTVRRALFGALDELALGWLLAGRRFPLSRAAGELATLFVSGLSATSHFK